MRPLYNFRWVPEGFWLIAQTVLGVLLVEVAGRLLELANMIEAGTLPTLATWQAWALALLVTFARTLAGALLARLSGGSFLKPGEKPVTPTSG